MKIGANMLLVIDEEKKEEMIGSIIVPSTVKEPQMKGKVSVVGIGTPDLPMVYAPGDIILYNPNAGSKVHIETTTYRLLDIREVKVAL